MRKVTASAVILTALTGCSQSSGIPSSQWSFEVPSEDAMSSPRSELDSESLANLDLSADAQSLVAESASRRTMGPAFEQPAVNAPSGDSTDSKTFVSNPSDSAELSALSAETYGLANGVSGAKRSTRPDPVAQVRAYLRASGSPSALTSRAPYTSEVYLSSLPVPNQYYNTDTIAADSLSPTLTSDEIPAASAVDLNLSDVSTDTSVSSAIVTSDFLPALSLVSNVSNETLPAVSEPADIAAYAQPEAVSYSDGLPQLVPGTITTAFTPNEDVSIGTAILNNLQQSSVDTSPTAPAPAVPNALDSLPQIVPISPAADQIATGTSSSTVAYPLAVQVSSLAFASAQPAPTLASLTETMPARELSPLVASYRSGSNPSEAAQPSKFPEDLSSTEPLDSPLMDSFREDTPLSTLYAPIAEPAAADASGTFIKEGINALGDEISTLELMSEIANTDLFSSVLVSPALVNNATGDNDVADDSVSTATAQAQTSSIAQRIPFANHEFSPGEPIRVFADQRVKSARKAAVTFAAKQAGKRRQALNWL